MLKSLTPTQRNIVTQMGFGSLFELKLTQTLDKDLCLYLLRQYSEGDDTIHLEKGKTVELKEIDVYLIFGLPRGEVKVVEASDHDQDPAYNELKDRLKQDFRIARGM